MSDDELVRQYLLGDLPGDEMEKVERRLLSDDDLFELAEAVEADVLDDYDRGELNPDQRQRVESYLAVSPEARLRLAVVQGLARTKPERRILPFPRLNPEERPQVRVAAIAAMLLLGVGAFLLSQFQYPVTQGAAKFPTDSPILHPTQPPPVPRDRVAEVTPTPAPPTPTPRRSDVYVLAISFLTQRDDTVPSFVIPQQKDIVELRFQLREADLGYTSYQVSLIQSDTGREVTERKGLKAKKSDDLLIVKVDASQFEEGRYSLTVQGIPSKGEPEDIEYSEFEVHRS